MNELHWLEAHEAAELIASKKLSPVELTQSLLNRIEKYDPGLNAFLTMRPEASLAAAKEAEDIVMRDDTSLGPLHGVPFALKDIIDVSSWPTTAHSKILADNIAEKDAEVTARLKAAGAILLGKLSTHEFALGGPSFDLPWPPARNPWGREYYPGGSSSGSGAAVAAGFVPIALGSDTGGSVRGPASMNGLLGMKPTYGRVSRNGVVPLSFSLDNVGPLTRTVRDNALALSIIAGFDTKDPASAELGVPNFSKDLDIGVKDLRIGVIRHFYQNDMIAGDDVIAAMEEALTVLSDSGAQIQEINTHPLIDYATCNRIILLSEACAIHQEWLTNRANDYAESTLSRLLPGTAFSAVDYVQALRTRARYAAEFNTFFNSFDAVITVNNMEAAFPIEDSAAREKYYPRQARAPFNVTGNPALAVPIGFSHEGLPISMQIITNQFDEAMAYRVAATYDKVTQWTAKHPDLDKTATLPAE